MRFFVLMTAFTLSWASLILDANAQSPHTFTEQIVLEKCYEEYLEKGRNFFDCVRERKQYFLGLYTSTEKVYPSIAEGCREISGGNTFREIDCVGRRVNEMAGKPWPPERRAR